MHISEVGIETLVTVTEAGGYVLCGLVKRIARYCTGSPYDFTVIGGFLLYRRRLPGVSCTQTELRCYAVFRTQAQYVGALEVGLHVVIYITLALNIRYMGR